MPDSDSFDLKKMDKCFASDDIDVWNEAVVDECNEDFYRIRYTNCLIKKPLYNDLQIKNIAVEIILQENICLYTYISLHAMEDKSF